MKAMPEHQKPPSFRNPPVEEVAIGVQFKEPLGLTVAHYGALLPHFDGRYPSVREQPPLPRAVELPPGQPNDQVREMDMFPARLWFVSESENTLVQVQRDRFIYNWRRIRPDAVYPRFSAVYRDFEREHGVFLNFLEKSGFKRPELDLCELTYVDHIRSGSVWKQHREVESVLKGLTIPQVPGDGVELEDADLRIRYSIKNRDGGFLGRLHFRATPGYRERDGSQEAVFVVNLVARGRPADSSDKSISTFFTEAHDRILSAFMSLTTSKLHEAWGLER
jgi:uncharacterized protein (TIGR04255 family)